MCYCVMVCLERNVFFQPLKSDPHVDILQPRNYPIHNALSPIIAALFTGNAIVVKCSEQVYWSSRWIIGSMRKALEVCGMDKDAVQVR
jgi:acyl-CoA reductase-like NAD-dependent aldehyde dehydrogenase